MATLSDSRILTLLEPFLANAPESSLLPTPQAIVISRLSAYLDVLLKWNARTNLTAIRDPEQIVQRHFGESLFAGLHLAPHLAAGDSVLDFGSGAGFPGLPIQILFSELKVTLAESQGKKAAFLSEAVRSLGVIAEVWSRRVEDMPLSRRFAAVTLRAVDNMDLAMSESGKKVSATGWMAVLTGEDGLAGKTVPIPGSEKRFLSIRQGA